jgi:hypothetical protein
MKKFIVLLFTALSFLLNAQTFTYSGYIYNSNGTGAINVPVKLYKRTTPSLTGFTSQTNYNGHSYYRSTGTAYWLDAKTACENMGGHLATISNAAENNFLYTTWPSGWIGYYQDKTGAFYSEASGGWRWTEPYVTRGQVSNYDVASYSSGTTLSDLTSGINATLYNSPVLTTTSGKYLTFNGSTQYGITGNVGSKMSSNVISILMWIYPTGNGVILSELGVQSSTSGWHESVFEITGGNTLKMGFWNGSGISQLSTPITLNTWNLVGVTYDGTTMTGYKNGVSIGTTVFNRSIPQNNGNAGDYFAFGLSDGTNMGSGLYGSYRLGSMQFYNVTLTADEMNSNYMSTAYRFGISPYSYWNNGEPNNSGGEDYAQFVGGGYWNDLPNTYLYQYVIEFNYIVTYTPWALYKTVYTDGTGKYTINESTNPATEWYMQIDAVTPKTQLQISDMISVADIVLEKTAKKSLHWNIYDVNGDGDIDIADIYYINKKRLNIVSMWNGIPISSLYTSAQFSILNTSTTNLKSTYSGLQTITITTPATGGSSNYYLLSPGYSGQLTY